MLYTHGDYAARDMEMTRKFARAALETGKSSVPTISDQVFEALKQELLTLTLMPNSKISEAEVAKRMGVSRQPVREAFKRLARLGFLQIRPQSGTKVSLISEEAVLRARFIRTALELHTCRTAASLADKAGLAGMERLLSQQEAAISAADRDLFHALDDQFHREICVFAGVGYVWDLIHESKAHMDRIRLLSLNTSSQQLALKEHIEIFDAISKGDAEAAATAMNKHLSRILVLIEEIKAANHGWFTDLAR